MIRMIFLAFSCLSLLVLTTQKSYADLNASVVLTVEWLVTNSDGIFLIENRGGKKETIEVLKGTPPESYRDVSKRPLDMFKRTIFHPPSRASVVLLFLKGSNVLQEVGISRDRDPKPSLYTSFYGVTETGRIITDEPSLIREVKICLEERRGKIVSRIPQIPDYKKCQFPAPPWFVFESGSDIYSLAVPNDECFRDALVDLANSGSAVERIWALRCLATNDDNVSLGAIKKLAASIPTAVSKTTIPYRRSGALARPGEMLDGGAVQEFAKNRLDWLHSNRRSIDF